MCIQIKPVTANNLPDILNLKLLKTQQSFIETPQECLIEAKEYPNFRPVGLYYNEELIGFAMYGLFQDINSEDRVWLDRFLIDYHFQGKGLGKKMLQALIDHLLEVYDCDKIYLSLYEDNKVALSLYQQFGFTFTGELDTKQEKIMVKMI